MTKTVIPLCSSSKSKLEKTTITLLFYGLPSVLAVSMLAYGPSKNTLFFSLFALLLILSVVKTARALREIRIDTDGSIIIMRGVRRNWKQLREPEANTLVHYTSIKRGSTYSLKITPQNIISISQFDSTRTVDGLDASFLENPDSSPFVLGKQVLAIKLAKLKFESLRPLRKMLKTNLQEKENVTIYCSVYTYEDFFKALPEQVKRKIA